MYCQQTKMAVLTFFFKFVIGIEISILSFKTFRRLRMNTLLAIK